MTSKYNLTWLTDKFDHGEALKFLFFWGHSNALKEKVGKFCFSQWFELPFVVDDVTYQTAEHWMMANKASLFNDSNTHLRIINAKTPGEAKELGRQVTGFDEQVWIENRYDIVVKGNIHKFNQYPLFAEFLINTKGRVLVEASPVDKIWGVGMSKDAEQIENPHFWNGENLLGFALMEVRDFLADFGTFRYIDNYSKIPWKVYPGIDTNDMFWKMGIGEDLLFGFFSYYNSLSQRDKIVFGLCNPTPYSWKGIFN
jgi:ribA/ribD-fused uncharacterized protein